MNNRVLFEGVLKIYWGVKKALILAPGAAYAKQRHNRQSIYDFVGVDDGAYLMMLEEASKAQMRRELQDGEKKRLREITENSVLLSKSGQWWQSVEIFSVKEDTIKMYTGTRCKLQTRQAKVYALSIARALCTYIHTYGTIVAVFTRAALIFLSILYVLLVVARIPYTSLPC